MDKLIPVHREIPGQPGRKITTPLDKPGSLIYYCPNCNRKLKKMPGYGACPHCEGPVVAKNKEKPE